MALTQEQARALWDAGGFAVLTSLPPGSEVGLDGIHHATASFAGYKFVPPGVHALVWSPAPSSSPSTASGPGAGLPLRSALIKHWAARERAALALSGDDARPRTIDEAELRALDPQLAPYPFANLEAWKKLSGAIGREVLDAALGEVGGVVDSLTGVEGEEDEVEEVVRKRRREADDVGGKEGEEEGAGEKGEEGGKAGSATLSGEIAAPDTVPDGEARIRLPAFGLKRSWRPGATGNEVTRWSRDKSDLWARVCAAHGGPAALLGHTALAFVLATQVWNAPSLSAYRRLLALQCRAHAALAEPELFPDAFPPSTPAALSAGARVARVTSLALVDLLAAQIASLPDTAFAVEVPGLDEFYQDEIEVLRRGLGSALAVRGWWGLAGKAQGAWTRLQGVGRARGWEIGPLPQGDEEDDDDEDGEYAPVVVEL